MISRLHPARRARRLPSSSPSERALSLDPPTDVVSGSDLRFRVIGRREGMAISPLTVSVVCPWFLAGGAGPVGRDGRAGAVSGSELVRRPWRLAGGRLRRAGSAIRARGASLRADAA